MTFATYTFENAAIRVSGTGDTLWFVARDVAEALGFGNPRQAVESHVDEDDKGVQEMDTPGGRQRVVMITESGLYALVFGSTLPSAKRFKRWVTHEVLPQIRQTGAYAGAAPMALPNYAEALRQLADKVEENAKQARALALAAPKVAFVERYVEADTGMKGFRQVAKLLKANEARFREFLIDSKIMYRLGGEWMAHQQHIDAGRFEVKTGEAHGHAFNRCLFTPKGVEWVAGQWAVHNVRAEVD